MLRKKNKMVTHWVLFPAILMGNNDPILILMRGLVTCTSDVFLSSVDCRRWWSMASHQTPHTWASPSLSEFQNLTFRSLSAQIIAAFASAFQPSSPCHSGFCLLCLRPSCSSFPGISDKIQSWWTTKSVKSTYCLQRTQAEGIQRPLLASTWGGQAHDTLTHTHN